MRAWAAVTLIAASAVAAPPAPKKKPAAASESPSPVMAQTTAEALTELERLYRTLEYDQVLPLADALLARPGLSAPERREALRLLGCAKAIVQDPVDAERPFRLLLRSEPAFDLPPDTPPKILAVFRKVQSEEQALALQLKGVERAKLIANLRIQGEPPKELLGGRPIRFSYRLRDTAGVVESVRVIYRRAQQKAFSSLALERSDDGEWRGTIPGEFTAGAEAFQLEYVTQTGDAEGPLLELGSERAPLTLSVLPGTVPVKAFKPLPPPVFVTAASFTAASGLAAIVMGVLLNREQTSFDRLALAGAAGASLGPQIARGQAFATATNVLMISTAVLAAGTLMLLPFTRFSEE